MVRSLYGVDEAVPAIWVFMEQEGGLLHNVSLELLSKGRQLADTLKVPLAAALLGRNVESLAQPLFHHGTGSAGS